MAMMGRTPNLCRTRMTYHVRNGLGARNGQGLMVCAICGHGYDDRAAHRPERQPMATEEQWRSSYEGKIQDLARETQRTERLVYELRHVRKHFEDVRDGDEHADRHTPEQWLTWIDATLDICGVDPDGGNYVTAPWGNLLPVQPGDWR